MPDRKLTAEQAERQANRDDRRREAYLQLLGQGLGETQIERILDNM